MQDKEIACTIAARRCIDTASHPFAVLVHKRTGGFVACEFVQSRSSAACAERRLSRVHRGHRVAVVQVGAAGRK